MNTPEHVRRIVLVALDGSPAATAALPVARTVAAQIGAAVAILHVAAIPLPESDLRKRLGLNRSDTEALRLRSALGDPVAEILRAAEAPDMALLVLTTHGRGSADDQQLGRVAEAIIAASVRPILCVNPERIGAAAGIPALRRLLLALDGSPATAMALRPATELASRLGASIDLLYVADRDQAPHDEPGSIGAPRYVDQPQHEWPHWADEVIDRLCRSCADCPPDVPVRMFLACGEIGAEIVRFAAEHHHDAIVLVRRSRLEPGRAQALRAVLAHAPCPVLVVGGLLA